MATLVLQIFTFFFFLPRITVATTTACSGSTCTTSGPLVRFPFHLRNHQPSSCGNMPKFNLSCNYQNQTLLTLPSSGDFMVQSINYKLQTLNISDLQNCLPRRFLHRDISLKNSPFSYSFGLQNYTFVACSSEKPYRPWNYGTVISCLSAAYEHKIVLAVPAGLLSPPFAVPLPSGCSLISTALVPDDMFKPDLGVVQLTWHIPDCRSCEASGRVCGLVNGTITSQIGCFGSSKSRFPRLPIAVRYVLGMGIALCIIGLGIYVCGKTRRVPGQLRPTVIELLSAIPDRRPSGTGLDGPTIESYPKTLVGESWELPKLNDKSCPICLCEYKPKETLRTIPECKHYFHANCIDTWLRTNATCPLCRNPQEGHG